MKRENGKVVLPSGSTRSDDIGKARPSLLWPRAIMRLAERCGLGAVSHGENNFRKGQPYTVVVDHLLVHLLKWLAGDRSDDHLAAVGWGVCTLMEQEERITAGALPAELDDLYFSPARRKEPEAVRTVDFAQRLAAEVDIFAPPANYAQRLDEAEWMCPQCKRVLHPSQREHGTDICGACWEQAARFSTAAPTTAVIPQGGRVWVFDGATNTWECNTETGRNWRVQHEAFMANHTTLLHSPEWEEKLQNLSTFGYAERTDRR